MEKKLSQSGVWKAYLELLHEKYANFIKQVWQKKMRNTPVMAERTKKKDQLSIMKAILERWYVGLIIVPIAINYLTEVISLPAILKDWKISVIVSEFILIIILLYELRSKSRGSDEFASPKQSDKLIIKDLLDTLDVNMFQRDIYEQDSWYGYTQVAIKKVLAFSEKVNRISNSTTDGRLNTLMSDFNESLEGFTELSATELYGLDSTWYSPDKGTEHGRARIEKSRPIMNQMTTDAFERLNILLKYLKEKEYI